MKKSKNPNLIKNGGTGSAVGKALKWLGKQGKVIAPGILEAASKITGIESLSDLGDLIKGDEDLNDLDKELLIRELDFDIQMEQELTKRLAMDNEHPITRLIRPVTYGSMFIMFLSMVFFDGNILDFEIKDVYIPVIESLFSTMTVFYFGSRGIEKLMKTWKK